MKELKGIQEKLKKAEKRIAELNLRIESSTKDENFQTDSPSVQDQNIGTDLTYDQLEKDQDTIDKLTSEINEIKQQNQKGSKCLRHPNPLYSS